MTTTTTLQPKFDGGASAGNPREASLANARVLENRPSARLVAPVDMAALYERVHRARCQMQDAINEMIDAQGGIERFMAEGGGAVKLHALRVYVDISTLERFGALNVGVPVRQGEIIRGRGGERREDGPAVTEVMGDAMRVRGVVKRFNTEGTEGTEGSTEKSAPQMNAEGDGSEGSGIAPGQVAGAASPCTCGREDARACARASVSEVQP